MSLATIHRELFHTAGLADIHVDELLDSIVRQVVVLSSGASGKVEVDTDFAPVRLTPDQAVPAALLVAEAVASALREAGTDGETRPRVVVALERIDDNKAEIRVCHELGKRHSVAQVSDAQDNLGQQLLAAFASQLGAKVEESEKGSLSCLSVRFNIRPLSEAEQRAQIEVPA